MGTLAIMGSIGAIVAAVAGVVGCVILIANFISRSKTSVRSEGVKEGTIEPRVQRLETQVKGLAASVESLRTGLDKFRDDVGNLINTRIAEAFGMTGAVKERGPQSLTGKGKKVSKEIGAKDIAHKIAPKLVSKARGLSDYGIQELCTKHLIGEFKPNAEVKKKMEDSANRNGFGALVVKMIIAIELRDILLETSKRKELA